MTDQQPFSTPPEAAKTSPEALLARLDAQNIPYTLYHHEAVFTSAQAASVKNAVPGMQIKNLFIRDKKERMALVVVPHDINLDLKTLAPAIGMDRISFGSPERLWTHLGVRPGSVCPFAAMNDTEGRVEVIMHAQAASAPVISVHPMLNTMSLAIAGPDVVRFLASVNHPPRTLDLNAFCRAA